MDYVPGGLLAKSGPSLLPRKSGKVALPDSSGRRQNLKVIVEDSGDMKKLPSFVANYGIKICEASRLPNKDL
jgi:hypothetical protein